MAGDTEDSAMKEAAEVLDLTNSQLPNLEGVQISPDLKFLDLTANRLTSVDPRILALKGLQSVNLRQNLLTDASAWSIASCNDSLQDLELRDNQLRDIPSLAGFTALTRLEFSYNEIKSLDGLAALPPNLPLQQLYVAQNKVASILAIDHLTGLTTLELGSNRIRTIENLESLSLLQELWLGRNRIAEIKGLSHLTHLKRISIQSNRIERMTGLEMCTALEELYLSHNGIVKMEGLSSLKQLNILDLSSNRITKIQGLEGLTELRDLWLNDNGIASIEENVAPGIASVAPFLTTVYLDGCPLAKDPEYKIKMKALLPALQQLDANRV